MLPFALIIQALAAITIILYDVQNTSVVHVGAGRLRDAILSIVLESPYLPSFPSCQYAQEDFYYGSAALRTNSGNAGNTVRFTNGLLPTLRNIHCFALQRISGYNSAFLYATPTLPDSHPNPVDAFDAPHNKPLVAPPAVPLSACLFSDSYACQSHLDTFSIVILGIFAVVIAVCLLAAAVSMVHRSNKRASDALLLSQSLEVQDLLQSILPENTEDTEAVPVEHYQPNHFHEPAPPSPILEAFNLDVVFFATQPGLPDDEPEIVMQPATSAAPSTPVITQVQNDLEIACETPLPASDDEDLVEQDTVTLTAPAESSAPVLTQVPYCLLAYNTPLPDSPDDDLSEQEPALNTPLPDSPDDDLLEQEAATSVIAPVVAEVLVDTSPQINPTDRLKEIPAPAATQPPLLNFLDLRPNRGRTFARARPNALGLSALQKLPPAAEANEEEVRLSKVPVDPLYVIDEDERAWLDNFEQDPSQFIGKEEAFLSTKWSPVRDSTSVTQNAFQIRGDVFANAKSGSALVNALCMSETGVPVSWRKLDAESDEVEPPNAYHYNREFDVDLGEIELEATNAGNANSLSKSKKKFVMLWGSDDSLARSGARGRRPAKALENSDIDAPAAVKSLTLTTTARYLPEPVPELISPGEGSFDSSLASSFADISISEPFSATPSNGQVDSVVVVDDRDPIFLPTVQLADVAIKCEAAINMELKSILEEMHSSAGDATVLRDSLCAESEIAISTLLRPVARSTDRGATTRTAVGHAATTSRLALEEEEDDEEDEFSRPITLEGFTPGIDFARAFKVLSSTLTEMQSLAGDVTILGDRMGTATLLPHAAKPTDPEASTGINVGPAVTTSSLAPEEEEDDDEESEFSRPITLEGFTPGFDFTSALRAVSSSYIVVEVPTVEPPRKITS